MKSHRSENSAGGDFARAREKMITEVLGRGIKDPRVIEALRRIPRHLFVPEALAGQAYGDSALPIGDGQTISQPYMVAYLGESLRLSGKEKVLEIGTGSGYQTAILACLAQRVFSVERIRSLLERARKTLDQIHCHNVITRLFDGSYGWQEEAPFDAILVTAGAPSLPKPLLDQLKVGGRMVVPIGDRNQQKLIRFEKKGQGYSEEDLGECSFVALVGDHGWAKREKWTQY